jgi:hypothetical protein
LISNDDLLGEIADKSKDKGIGVFGYDLIMAIGI